MRMTLFCLVIFNATICLAQPKSEGLYDSLNGKVRSMTAYFFNISKDSKGRFEAKPDYFSHHQEFIYNEQGVLQFRNFYEDKKKIRESRDMIAFNKPDPAVRNDTSYSSTDSTREMLITRYRNGKVNEFRKYITLLKDDKVWFWIYMNADGSISVYDKFVMTVEGKEKSRWQAFADNPLDLKKDPNLWEKYNEHGHLMLSVYNMKNGVKKSSGRKYEYDEHNNAVWIQFTEWNAASNTYEPVRETKMEYKYGK